MYRHAFEDMAPHRTSGRIWKRTNPDKGMATQYTVLIEGEHQAVFTVPPTLAMVHHSCPLGEIAISLNDLEDDTVLCRWIQDIALLAKHVHEFALNLSADLRHGHVIGVSFEWVLRAFAHLLQHEIHP